MDLFSDWTESGWSSGSVRLPVRRKRRGLPDGQHAALCESLSFCSSFYRFQIFIDRLTVDRGGAVAGRGLLTGWGTPTFRVWTWPVQMCFHVPVSAGPVAASTRPGAPSCWTSPSRCSVEETGCMTRCGEAIRPCLTSSVIKHILVNQESILMDFGPK